MVIWKNIFTWSVHASTLSIIYISETSWQIQIKFHLEHFWDGRKAALGFEPDRIGTLVSMAAYSFIGI